MKNLTVMLFIATLVACNSASHNEKKIAGVYTRESSMEVSSPDSGVKIGRRIIRDSIFVQPLNNDTYNIRNSKWMLNDYDQDGWRSMKHSENRPMPDFVAAFNGNDKSLRSDNSEFPTLYLDEDGILKGKSQNKYLKVK